ncbi:hypothetical protein [Sphingomonas sp.]|uniref:hypothetical protein n=1 Tax=Sphingomonas sp. TaxID=28214 RepID=UPI002DD64486|nr:hypothetical protein [Sphingomonas sp.]
MGHTLALRILVSCRRGRSAYVALVMMAACLAGSPGSASAQTTDIPAAITSSATSSISLVLTGSVTPDCSIAGGATLALGTLGDGQQAVAEFDIGCNLPFDLVFRSSSGGIAHSTRPEGEGPYGGKLGYRLGVTLPTLTPDPQSLRADFSSRDMIGGSVLSSGNAIAMGRGEIRLQTELPAGTELLAGQYADKITITINPRI